MADTDLVLDNTPQWDVLPLTPIETPSHYVAVGEHLKDVARYEKKVEAFFRGTEDNPGPLTLQWKAYQSLLVKEKEALAPAKADRALCDTLLIDYDDRQAAVAAAAQREAEAQAIKDAETRQVATAAAVEMMAEGASVEEAAALREEAKAILDAPVEADPVHVAKSTPKVAGVTLKDNWKANKTVWQQMRDLKLLAAAVLGITGTVGLSRLKINASLVNFLTPNWSALDQQAKATKGTAKIPGVTFFNDRGTSARTK